MQLEVLFLRGRAPSLLMGNLHILTASREWAPLLALQAFQRQIHERLTQLELINKQYRRLARENRTDSASKLKHMVHEGNQRWDNLQKRVTSILRRLKVVAQCREGVRSTWRVLQESPTSKAYIRATLSWATNALGGSLSTQHKPDLGRFVLGSWRKAYRKKESKFWEISCNTHCSYHSFLLPTCQCVHALAPFHRWEAKGQQGPKCGFGLEFPAQLYLVPSCDSPTRH